MRQESHRIYLQQFAPRSPALSSSSSSSSPAGPSPRRGNVVTTSAAVRLTDGARTVDVTRLLRGKFGLPPALNAGDDKDGGGCVGGTGGNGGGGRLDKIKFRLVELRSSGTDDADGTSSDNGANSAEPSVVAPSPSPPPPLLSGEADALVLVGTLTSLPRHYVRFEHEAVETIEAGSGASDGIRLAGSTPHAQSNGSEPGSQSSVDGGQSPNIIPPSPDSLGNLHRVKSTSSAVTLKATGNASRRAYSTASSNADSDDGGDGTSSLAIERGGRRLDPNRDPMDLSSSQGYPIVAVDRVRSGPGSQTSNLSGDNVREEEDAMEKGDASNKADALSNALHVGFRTGSDSARPGRDINDQAGYSGKDEDALCSSLHVGFKKGSESGWANTLPGRNAGVGTVATEPPSSSRSAEQTQALQPLDPRPAPSRQEEEARNYPSQHSRIPNASDGPTQPRKQYEVSSEPYNIIRTLRPNENPLAVRDELVGELLERKRHAEIELGVLGMEPRGFGAGGNSPTPQVRWFFQPSCGKNEGAGKVRNVPACVDVDGYCSGMDDDNTDHDDDANREVCSDEGADAGGGRNDAGPIEEEQREELDGSPTIRRWWRDGGTTSNLENARPYRYWASRKDESGHPSQPPPSSPRRPFDLDPSQLHLRHCGHALSSAQARLSDERHKVSILLRHESAVDNPSCLSGYLLKRSTQDYNVWRRVYCVLVNDRLWWATRMRTVETDEGGSEGKRSPGVLHSSTQYGGGTAAASPMALKRSVHFGTGSSKLSPRSAAAVASTPPPIRIARHHCIRLTSTLLLESDPTHHQTTPGSLSRLPNAFELITSTGVKHIFRSPPSFSPRPVQLRWVEAIAERIVGCSENNGMEMAELIGSEEILARWNRSAGLGVGPVLDFVREEAGMAQTVPKVRADGACLWSRNGWIDLNGGGVASEAAIAEVLRFGMDVAEYREAVRHARRIMPQVSVVVVGSTSTNGVVGVDAAGTNGGPAGSGRHSEDKIMGRVRHGAIASTWESVVSVLAKSSRIVGLMTRHQSERTVDDIMDDEDDRVATKKREVVAIQSQISQVVEEQKVRMMSAVKNGDGPTTLLLPPLDLFDELLVKFQRLAAIAEGRRLRYRRRPELGGVGWILAGLPRIVAGDKSKA